MRLAKVRAMSPVEVIQRGRYAMYCAFERAMHRRGRLSPPDRLRLALLPALRARSDWKTALLTSRQQRRGAFFAGTDERVRMRALFDREYRCERDLAVAAADRVLQGDIEFFGQTFHIGSGVAWNCDPVSGAEWPRLYHRDVPIQGGNRGWGDVKSVWELNRHQFLIDIGRASFLTDDPKYAARVRELVADWMDDNPYATGVNWSCALEPAFRALSWLWTYSLCSDGDPRDPEHHLLWLAGFYDHGRFLHRHLEHYASPFNHLIGEACALYLLGVLFPEFHEAAAWRRRGRTVLESRLSEQFYADGGSVEQSTFYHHATLGFYLLAAVLGRRHGEEFSPGVWEAIERAISFSAALVQPDGTTPSIGGADDGKPLRMEHLPFWNFRPFQAIGSVLFGRKDFKYLAGRFYEDALWLLGPEGLERFNALSAEPPEESSVGLRDSGYYLLRSDWSPQADYVCIDCGEQAGGLRTDAVPNAVHGHADCLSVVVWLGGRPVLMDAGLFCYNGDPAWVAHFRSTAAHNTARIDGRDQALHVGPMAWSHSYRANAEVWSVEQPLAAFMGSHDGYTRRGGDTIHRRLVWLRPNAYLVIYDEFECRSRHDLELNFQFVPGKFDVRGQSHASHSDGIHCVWTGSIPLTTRLRQGGSNSDEGWIAPSLGVRVAAPRLTLAGRIGPGTEAVLTVIAARQSTGGIRLSIVNGDQHGTRGVVRVEGGDFDDYVCAPSITPMGTSGGTDGKAVVWRFLRDGHADVCQVGGTYVTAVPPIQVHSNPGTKSSVRQTLDFLSGKEPQ